MERAKRMLSVMLALALMLTGLSLYGMEVKAAEQSGDYQYQVNEDGNSVTITEYNGSGAVIIPSELDGKQVTGIGNSAFSDCNLTSIEIPSSVESIEERAFRDNDSLTSIKVDESNLKYDSRDTCNAIIKKDSNTLIQGCKNTKIPVSVTSIGSYVFECY